MWLSCYQELHYRRGQGPFSVQMESLEKICENTHRDACLPPPNAIVINKANGHAHALTLLATPVAKHSAARVV